ncbi:MAG: hypothetical protein U5S82_21320 [Gammaproteobacteria bacterium]|nr:hypothetical protein [Gammaproteobacteria bacterium]
MKSVTPPHRRPHGQRRVVGIHVLPPRGLRSAPADASRLRPEDAMKPVKRPDIPAHDVAARRAVSRVMLLDFGGVLVEEGFRAALEALARRQGLDPGTVTLEGRRALHDSGYVTGTGGEADFWRLMRWRTGLEGSDAELREAVLNRFLLRPEILKAVAALRRTRAPG